MVQLQADVILSHFPNVAFDVVAIAASLGGLDAIRKIVTALPADFPAAIIVVQHFVPDQPSLLSKLLSNCTTLNVKRAEAGELLRPGTVYVAVPNKHLLVKPDGTLSLSEAAKECFVRPSATVLFESVAVSFKRRAIAVVLTGRGSDGAKGVEAIKQQGGIVIAQDQATSRCFGMPKAALETGCVDFTLPPNLIASTLVALLVSKTSSLSMA